MDDITALTSQLMRFRTTADNPDELKRCADFIQKYLESAGVMVMRHVKNGKPSLVALFSSSKSPEVFLNAHVDVVPASDEQFTPKMKDGKLCGRGSEDCKAQVAILMVIMKKYAAHKTPPSAGLMLTFDEEIGGHDGVEYLLKEVGYRCKFALVADAGDEYEIIVKHKGILQVKVSAVGKAAHSSMYWDGGENAIEKLMTAYEKIQKLFPKLSGPAWKTTCNLARISGGDVMNKVPDSAELYLDIRRTEKDTEEKILGDLRNIPHVSVEKVGSAAMLHSSETSPYVTSLRAAAKKVLGKQVPFGYAHGATDARYFAEVGIDAVCFKPLGYGAHSDNEYALIASFGEYSKILHAFLESLT
jgi:succinyl-diaminopimelate desuccinylase